MLVGLKPDLNCIRGRSTRDCMDKIRLGDADMIALDAADVFVAGKYVTCLYLDISTSYIQECLSALCRTV